MSSIEHRHNEVTDTDSWRVRFRLDGRNRAVTFTSQAKANSWRELLDALGPGKALRLLEEIRPETLRTVADHVDHHIEHLTGVTDGTRRRYRHIAEAQIRPTFGSVLLSDLTRDHVARWVNTRDAAPKTIANWHGLLSSALASAVDAGLVATNPAYRMRLPRKQGHDSTDMCLLTRAEVGALLGELGEHWRPLVTLLVSTGLRWGEATALRVRDVDPANRSATVRQSWKHTEGQGYELGEPKTVRSRRTIAVPDGTLEILAPLMAGRRPDDIILRNKVGSPIRSGSFHGRVWQPAMDRYEDAHGKRPRIHDLRHTYASWAIQAGIPLPVIQRQLGHESIQTTVDTYGHLARSDFDPLLSLGAPAPVERLLLAAADGP